MKYLVEFVGTFLFVTSIGSVVMDPGAAPAGFAPLAIGSALMVMIYAGGHVSGAHYNPAVTLAVCIRGKCSFADVPGYIIAQCAGAAAAGFVVLFLKGSPNLPAPKDLDVVRALVAELIYTFALAYVVLNVATAKATAGNSFYGLAIGFTVVVGAFSVGSISGGVFNPAVAVGITVMGLSAVKNIWIYLVADFIGAILAAALFQAINPDDK